MSMTWQKHDIISCHFWNGENLMTCEIYAEVTWEIVREWVEWRRVTSHLNKRLGTSYQDFGRPQLGGCHLTAHFQGRCTHSRVRKDISIWRIHPFGFFFVKFGQDTSWHIQGLLFSHFWNMSIYDNSRSIWLHFQKETPSENQFSRWRSNNYPLSI